MNRISCHSTINGKAKRLGDESVRSSVRPRKINDRETNFAISHLGAKRRLMGVDWLQSVAFSGDQQLVAESGLVCGKRRQAGVVRRSALRQRLTGQPTGYRGTAHGACNRNPGRLRRIGITGYLRWR